MDGPARPIEEEIDVLTSYREQKIKNTMIEEADNYEFGISAVITEIFTRGSLVSAFTEVPRCFEYFEKCAKQNMTLGVYVDYVNSNKRESAADNVQILVRFMMKNGMISTILDETRVMQKKDTLRYYEETAFFIEQRDKCRAFLASLADLDFDIEPCQFNGDSGNQIITLLENELRPEEPIEETREPGSNNLPDEPHTRPKSEKIMTIFDEIELLQEYLQLRLLVDDTPVFTNDSQFTIGLIEILAKVYANKSRGQYMRLFNKAKTGKDMSYLKIVLDDPVIQREGSDLDRLKKVIKYMVEQNTISRLAEVNRSGYIQQYYDSDAFLMNDDNQTQLELFFNVIDSKVHFENISLDHDSAIRFNYQHIFDEVRATRHKIRSDGVPQQVRLLTEMENTIERDIPDDGLLEQIDLDAILSDLPEQQTMPEETRDESATEEKVCTAEQNEQPPSVSETSVPHNAVVERSVMSEHNREPLTSRSSSSGLLSNDGAVDSEKTREIPEAPSEQPGESDNRARGESLDGVVQEINTEYDTYDRIEQPPAQFSDSDSEYECEVTSVVPSTATMQQCGDPHSEGDATLEEKELASYNNFEVNAALIRATLLSELPPTTRCLYGGERILYKGMQANLHEYDTNNGYDRDDPLRYYQTMYVCNHMVQNGAEMTLYTGKITPMEEKYFAMTNKEHAEILTFEKKQGVNRRLSSNVLYGTVEICVFKLSRVLNTAEKFTHSTTAEVQFWDLERQHQVRLPSTLNIVNYAYYLPDPDADKQLAKEGGLCPQCGRELTDQMWFCSYSGQYHCNMCPFELQVLPGAIRNGECHALMINQHFVAQVQEELQKPHILVDYLPQVVTEHPNFKHFNSLRRVLISFYLRLKDCQACATGLSRPFYKIFADKLIQDLEEFGQNSLLDMVNPDRKDEMLITDFQLNDGMHDMRLAELLGQQWEYIGAPEQALLYKHEQSQRIAVRSTGYISFEDIYDVLQNGRLFATLDKTIGVVARHVHSCSHCRGHQLACSCFEEINVCDYKNVYVCEQCGLLMHRHCYEKNGSRCGLCEQKYE